VLMCENSQESYAQKQHQRMKKAAKWLCCETTALQQGVALACIMPLVQFMGRIFTDSAASAVGEKSVLDFCLAYRSPARRTLQRYYQLLGDETDLLWLTIRGPCPFTAVSYRKATTACVFIMASIWWRCVLPFLSWPWKLAVLGCPLASEEEKGQASCRPAEVKHLTTSVANPVFARMFSYGRCLCSSNPHAPAHTSGAKVSLRVLSLGSFGCRHTCGSQTPVCEFVVRSYICDTLVRE
jgi:hypothetical protein